MSDTLGTIRGQMILDVKQALNSYTAARQAHISTVTALATGGGAIATAGAMIAGAGVAMGAGLLTAVNAAAEFERKLDYFTAVGGPDAIANYDAIRQKALQLGQDTIYSADQIADSFVELAKSGVGAQDIINGIGEGVAALGAAADIPLDAAANIITAAVATFQLGAENAVKVADQLAGAANASIVEVQDLGVSLKYAGGVAASLQVPFEDVNTALAILGVNGIKGSTAGTSLRQVLLSLNGATAKAKSALKELGIITEDGTNKFYNMDGSAKSLAEVFQILQDATKDMSDQQKVATFQQIFATRALPSLIALTRAGADGFADMYAEISKTTAFDVASQRLDNLSGDLEILRGNIETLMIESGSGFQEFARGLVQGITNMIQAFSDLPDSVQQVILIFTAVVSALLIFVGFTGVIAGSILNIIGLFIRMSDAFGGFGKILGPITKAIGFLFALLLRNPIGLIITAIAALVSALVWFFTSTETGQATWAKLMAVLQQALAVAIPWIQNLITVVGGALVSAFQALMPVLATVIDFLANTFTSILPTIVTIFQSIITAIVPIITTLAELFAPLAEAFAPVLTQLAESGARLVTAFAPVISTVVNELAPALVELGTTISQLVVLLAPLIQALAGELLNILVTLVRALLPPLIALFTAIVPVITQLATVFTQFITQVLAAILPPLMQLISAILPILVQLFQAVVPVVLMLVQAFIPLITTIVELLIPVIVFLLDVITTVFEAIAPIIEAALSIVVGIIQTVTALLKGDWEGVWNGILAILQGVWDLIVGVVQGAWNILVAIFSNTINWLVGLWNSTWTNISNFLRDAWNNIVTTVAIAIANVIDWFKTLPNRILSSIANIGTWLINAGRDLIRGLGEGIARMGQWVLDQISNVINGAIDWAKGLLGIASPSKVFAEIGTDTIMGLVNGIAGEQRTLENQMKTMVDSMTDFYNQVGAAKEFDLAANLGTTMASASVGIDSSVAAQLAAINASLREVAEKDTFNIDKLEINNAEPEPASESLPNAIRKTTYMLG